MLIRFIIILLLIYLLWSIIKFFRRAKSDRRINNDQFKSKPISGEDLVEDPVCHIYVPVSQAYKKEIAGESHYFCSKECCEVFILKNKQ